MPPSSRTFWAGSGCFPRRWSLSRSLSRAGPTSRSSTMPSPPPPPPHSPLPQRHRQRRARAGHLQSTPLPHLKLQDPTLQGPRLQPAPPMEAVAATLLATRETLGKAWLASQPTVELRESPSPLPVSGAHCRCALAVGTLASERGGKLRLCSLDRAAWTVQLGPCSLDPAAWTLQLHSLPAARRAQEANGCVRSLVKAVRHRPLRHRSEPNPRAGATRTAHIGTCILAHQSLGLLELRGQG